jgi:hypothetical protein
MSHPAIKGLFPANRFRLRHDRNLSIRAQRDTKRSAQSDSMEATVTIIDWKIVENLDGVKK